MITGRDFEARRCPSPLVSDPRVSVAVMKHTCVYYEDGWPDITCACGERAAVLVDDDGETVLVPLVTPRTSTREQLPISA